MTIQKILDKLKIILETNNKVEIEIHKCGNSVILKPQTCEEITIETLDNDVPNC
jgi:hypothetical protein